MAPCSVYISRAHALREDDREQRQKLWTDMPPSCRAPVCNTIATNDTRKAHALCCTQSDTTIPASSCDIWSPCRPYVVRGQQLTIDDHDAMDALWRDMEPSCRSSVCGAIGATDPQTAFNLCCLPADAPFDETTCSAWAKDGVAKDNHATAVTVGKYFLGFGTLVGTYKWLIHTENRKAVARRQADAAARGMTVAELDEEDARWEALMSRQSPAVSNTPEPQWSDRFPGDGRSSFDSDMDELQFSSNTTNNPLSVGSATGEFASTNANPLAAGPDLSLVIAGAAPEWDGLGADARADAVRLGYSGEEWNAAVTPQSARDSVVRQIQKNAIASGITDERSRARFDLLVDDYPGFSPQEVQEALEQTDFHAGRARNVLNSQTPKPRRSYTPSSSPPGERRASGIVYRETPTLFTPRDQPRTAPSPRTPRTPNDEGLSERNRAWLEQVVGATGSTAFNETLGRPVTSAPTASFRGAMSMSNDPLDSDPRALTARGRARLEAERASQEAVQASFRGAVSSDPLDLGGAMAPVTEESEYTVYETYANPASADRPAPVDEEYEIR